MDNSSVLRTPLEIWEKIFECVLDTPLLERGKSRGFLEWVEYGELSNVKDELKRLSKVQALLLCVCRNWSRVDIPLVRQTTA